MRASNALIGRELVVRYLRPGGPSDTLIKLDSEKSSMNRYQWYASAGILFLMATVFGNWTALTGFGPPDTVTWAVGRAYSMATWFCYGLSGICVLCGKLEGFERKKHY